MQLLRELCRTVDRLDELERALAEGGMSVTGIRGQLPKASPLPLEMREFQKTMSLASTEVPPVPPGVRRAASRASAPTSVPSSDLCPPRNHIRNCRYSNPPARRVHASCVTRDGNVCRVVTAVHTVTRSISL